MAIIVQLRYFIDTLARQELVPCYVCGVLKAPSVP